MTKPRANLEWLLATLGFPGGSGVKNLLQCRRYRFYSWVGKIPYRRKWQCTPVFLPGKSHRFPEELGMLQFMGLQKSQTWLSDYTTVTTCLTNYALVTVKNQCGRRTRWWKSKWTWSTSLSTDSSGIHLQTQKCLQNTSWEWTGVPDQCKRIYRTMQNLVGWRNWKEKQEC